MIDAMEAADSLATIRSSRNDLVRPTPAARHWGFAALMGTLVAAPAVALPWRFGILAALVAGIAAIMRWDRRRTGMFINGYRAGRTRKVTVTMLVFCLTHYAVSVWLADVRHMVWPSLVLGAVALVVSWISSRYWCTVFEREMTSDL